MKLMLDTEDDKMYVIDTARLHKLGSKEEIELYEELTLAMELMENEKFTLVGSGIGGGLDFSIVTPYPHGLPEKMGILFFNISPDFGVKIKETSQYTYSSERHFEIKINKI
jgi:hypothetical protein